MAGLAVQCPTAPVLPTGRTCECAIGGFHTVSDIFAVRPRRRGTNPDLEIARVERELRDSRLGDFLIPGADLSLGWPALLRPARELGRLQVSGRGEVRLGERVRNRILAEHVQQDRRVLCIDDLD